MEVCLDIMREGVTLKFTQVEGLRKALLSTNDKELIEASPRDSFWGVGVSLGNKDLRNRSKWGMNHLGKILMEVRDAIR